MPAVKCNIKVTDDGEASLAITLLDDQQEEVVNEVSASRPDATPRSRGPRRERK